MTVKRVEVQAEPVTLDALTTNNTTQFNYQLVRCLIQQLT